MKLVVKPGNYRTIYNLNLKTTATNNLLNKTIANNAVCKFLEILQIIARTCFTSLKITWTIYVLMLSQASIFFTSSVNEKQITMHTFKVVSSNLNQAITIGKNRIS